MLVVRPQAAQHGHGDTAEREGCRDMATSYDGELQMFREPSREPDLGVLRFLRWLAERGELEHALSGASSGELAQAPDPVPA
jgi:hypothetical protein